MTTYNFPLGSDHDDRDLARVQHDLLARPSRSARAARRAGRSHRASHWLLGLGREHG